MRLEKGALIAEIVSGVAIVVTLVVLISQVRSNTDAIRAQTIGAQRIAENQRRNRIIVNEGGIADLVVANRSSAASGDVDAFRLYIYYNDTLRNWEWQFIEAEEGRLPYERLDTRTWRDTWGEQPILEAAFRRLRADLDPAFVAYFEQSVGNEANE